MAMVTEDTELAISIKEHAEMLLETVRERIEEVDLEIRRLKKAERERSELLQQAEYLERIISVQPNVRHVVTERSKGRRGRSATPDGRTIADHIEEILRDVYPDSLHWEGIHAELKKRDVGKHWKSPVASVRVATRLDERFVFLEDGEYRLSRDYV